MAGKSLEELLREGRRPVLVEFDPPRTVDPDVFLEGARELSEAGADLITIADCPIGRASIDASLLAAKLKREYGIEPLPHMACRDRNLNAMQALLMGLGMEKVSAVLLVTGDPVAQERRDIVKGVFQYNSRRLAEELNRLMDSGDLPRFFLCGALNVNARNFDVELKKAVEKERCGIRAFLTQPVSSPQAEHNLRLARQHLSGAILGGLFPIVSHRNALFLQREVAGMSIDDATLQAYEGLSPAEGEELGRRLCLETAAHISGDVSGFYIMTPFRRVALVKTIMQGLRELKC